VREAVGLYRECLRSADLDQGTADDARHNLEVAKLLLLKLQAKGTPSRPEEDGSGKRPQPPEKRGSQPQEKPNGEPKRGMGDPQPSEDSAKKDGGKPKPIQKTTSGAGGNVEAPGHEPMPPLTPTEAAAELEQAWREIQKRVNARRDRNLYLPNGPVKDW
jgi:hypothetical protein